MKLIRLWKQVLQISLISPALFLIQAHADENEESLRERYLDEEHSLKERIEFLENSRGYHYKTRTYEYIAEGDLLYWKADVDGVAYATTQTQVEANGGFGDVATRYKTRTPHFSYDPGFRVGVGVRSPYDFVDVCVFWTRFYTEGRDRARGDLIPDLPTTGDRVIYNGIGLINDTISIPDRASAVCSIKENIADLQIARGIEVSRNFFMRPYFGLRAVWSDIDWRINFKRNFIVPSDAGQDETRLKIDNDFNAIGGLIGLYFDWKAPYGLGVHMRGAGALVWGKSKERTKQDYTFLPAGTAEEVHQTFKAGNSFYCLKGIWDLFIGAFWETDFTKKPPKEHLIVPGKEKHRRVVLRLMVGYEVQQWPWAGQKTNVQVNRERDRFSLGFQGFTGGAKLVF